MFSNLLCLGTHYHSILVPRRRTIAEKMFCGIFFFSAASAETVISCSRLKQTNGDGVLISLMLILFCRLGYVRLYDVSSLLAWTSMMFFKWSLDKFNASSVLQISQSGQKIFFHTCKGSIRRKKGI